VTAAVGQTWKSAGIVAVPGDAQTFATETRTDAVAACAAAGSMSAATTAGRTRAMLPG
jgi:hypothetical protein